jgi:anion-transporting  ArsA/GET3 family ATPase
MSSASGSLRELLATKRVLITVGAGGVGKTTTAAALAVAAAQRGRRVLCLTIDPAKRLAQSLGLDRMASETAPVDPGRFAAVGAPLRASLTVMVLDTKRTFDDIVLKYSSSPEKAEMLLTNRLYRYVSTSLAGTQEYMAMEKLVAVQADTSYDLIILDTPPTANALDFLDAPERMVRALDSAAIRWFTDAFQSTGKLSLNLLARSAALVLRGLGKITGGGFLEAMAEFITALNDLFGGFRARATMVEAALRSPEVAFVLVTSPAPMSIQEVLYLSDRLAASGMPRGALVVNRVRQPPPPLGDAGEADVAAALSSRRLKLGQGAAERLLHAHADAVKLAATDAQSLEQLRARVGDGMPVAIVPELPSDVCDARLLADLATLLAS